MTPVTAKKTLKTEATTKPTLTEPRNFLAAFVLTLTLGPMGVNRLYTGDTTLGWVRFGLFAGGFILSPVAVGIPLMFAAQIWGLIDVFLVYLGARTDADGVPMLQTERDRKYARVLYIIFIICLALAALALMVVLVAIVVSIMQGHTPSFPSEPTPDPYFFDSRNY